MFVIEPSSAVRMSNLCHTIIMCLRNYHVLYIKYIVYRTFNIG